MEKSGVAANPQDRAVSRFDGEAKSPPRGRSMQSDGFRTPRQCPVLAGSPNPSRADGQCKVLSQIVPITEVDANMKEAIEDWHYWVNRGYEL